MKSLNDVRHFMHFAANELQLKTLPKITFVGKQENKNNAFSSFNTKTTNIVVRVTDRHPIDIARSIAHELIHFKQKLSGTKEKESMKEDDANKLAGRIMQKYDTTFPKVFNDKAIKEDAIGPVAVNAMGSSSSTPGSGGIDTIDPLINKNNRKKKLKDILKKAGNNSNGCKRV